MLNAAEEPKKKNDKCPLHLFPHTESPKQNQATIKLGLEIGWKQGGQREFLGPDLLLNLACRYF